MVRISNRLLKKYIQAKALIGITVKIGGKNTEFKGTIDEVITNATKAFEAETKTMFETKKANGEFKTQADADAFSTQRSAEYKSTIINPSGNALNANIKKLHPANSEKSENVANESARKKLNGETPYINVEKKIMINGKPIN